MEGGSGAVTSLDLAVDLAISGDAYRFLKAFPGYTLGSYFEDLGTYPKLMKMLGHIARQSDEKQQAESEGGKKDFPRPEVDASSSEEDLKQWSRQMSKSSTSNLASARANLAKSHGEYFAYGS